MIPNRLTSLHRSQQSALLRHVLCFSVGKKVMRYLFSCFLLSTCALTHAKSLRVVVDAKQFFSPQVGTYVEFYMQFIASGIHFQGDSVHGFNAGISTQIIVFQADKIIQFDKFKIERQFSGKGIVEDIYGLKRFSLPEGVYVVEYEFVDLNHVKDTIQFFQEIEVEAAPETSFFSDILLIETMTKSKANSAFVRNGFEMIPRLINYYNVESERLIAYVELYNTHLCQELPKFALRYYLRDNASGRKLEDYLTTKVYKSAEVVPLVINMSIAQLGTGAYSLVVELLDSEERVIKKQEAQIDRFNPSFEDVVIDFSKTIIDPRFFDELPDDSLFYYLESLTPISSRADISQIYALIESKDMELAKKYFQSYWIRTNPKEPTDAWIKYKKSVLAVQKEFGTVLLPGFKSDRGRVFLQYGAPNARVQRPNEPGEYPYEIWQYYKIANFSNRRFIFYNPVGVGNEYVLLHSDMPGELFNNRFLQDLSRTGVPVRSRINDESIMEVGRRQ